jgi:unsaturated chondroitin disaccharide hydrolase
MVGRAREKHFTWLLMGCLCVLAAEPARAFDDATADRVLQFAQQQLNKTASNPQMSTTQSPKASTDGTWTFESSTNKIGWTQGFYPGLLWFMYERTGREPFWRTKAEAWRLLRRAPGKRLHRAHQPALRGEHDVPRAHTGGPIASG